MRIFLTGGSGYIGGAVLRTLREAGHGVTALARTEEAAARLEEAGAVAVAGELRDAARLAELARGHDAAVHLAQDRDAADRAAADRAVLDALAGALDAGGVLVYTSNVFLLGDQGERVLGEEDALPLEPRWGAWRLEVERHALGLGSASLAAAVIRPGQVYGGGDGGTLPMLWGSAAASGAAELVGDGRNRWSLVELEDLARLYLAVVEGRARGVYHGVDGEPVPLAEVARLASEAAGAGGRTRSIPLPEARAAMGDFAAMLALDVAAAAPRARALGWAPRTPSFAAGAPAAHRRYRASLRPAPAGQVAP